MKELLKATPESSPDRAKLERAMGVLQQLTQSINQRKSEQEQRAMVRIVQNQLVGLSVDLMAVVSRRLLREGTLSLVPDASTAVAFGKHKRQLYLFDDLLVVAHASVDKRGRHKADAVLELRDVQATTTAQGNTTVLVVVCKAADSKCLAFVAPSDAETQQWADDIQRNTQGVQKRILSFAEKHQ